MIKIFLYSLFSLFSVSAMAAADCSLADSFYHDGQKVYHQNQFLMASVQFKIAALTNCDLLKKQQSYFAYALSMNSLGESGEALETLNRLQDTATPTLKENLNLFKYLKLGVDTKAALSSQHKDKLILWDHRQFQPANYKSPALAGSLSALLPGAGQAYVGSWQSAAYSLVINALFLSAALELNRKDMPATSAAAWTVFSVTYLGGILSSVESAQLFNRNQTVKDEAQLYHDLFPELEP